MTPITRRDVERGLRLPAPSPPAELGRRIKDAIPDQLFAARDRSSDRDAAAAQSLESAQSRANRRPGDRRAVWALAASVLLVAGSGYLAVRWLGSEAPLETVDAIGSSPAGGRENDAVPGADSESPAAESELKLADRELDAFSATAGEPPARQESAASPSTSAPARAKAIGPMPARRIVEPAAIPEADSSLGAAAGTAPAAEAPAPAAPALAEAEERPIEPADLTRLVNERLLVAAASVPIAGEPSGAALAETARAGRAESRDAISDRTAADAPASSTSRAAAKIAASSSVPPIVVTGANARADGRAFLLVTAAIPDSGDVGLAPPSAIALDLDPARVRSHRLLAGPTVATTRGAADSRTEVDSGQAATPSRVVALYEIELTDAGERDGPLGTVALRSAVAREAERFEQARQRLELAKPIAGASRVIDRGDVATSWEQAPIELRLAVLAAEVAGLSTSSPAGAAAALERDLASLEVEPTLDPRAARDAAELRRALSRFESAPDDLVP